MSACRSEGIRLRGNESRTISWPAGLAVPDLNIVAAGHGLNASVGLHKIVEVLMGGVGDVLSLPESKRVDQKEIWVALDDGIGGAIGILAPAVCCSDFELAELCLNLLHLR